MSRQPPLRYLSLFSGIEAATVAWAPLGWECVAVAEIERDACAVLAERLPGVPNLGDVRAIDASVLAGLGRIDLVVGGSPCQNFSTAGSRTGLAGEQSSLFHEQARLFDAARSLCGARFHLWENVTGALSTNAGRDFACVAGRMAGARIDPPRGGFGSEGVAMGEAGLLEWCVLDAQWFALAQRRARVFALLDSGDWQGHGPLLLEPEALRGRAPSRDAAGRDAAGRPPRGARGPGAGAPGWGSTGAAIRLAQTGSNGWGFNLEGVAYTPDGTRQGIAARRAIGFNAAQDPVSADDLAVPVSRSPSPQSALFDGVELRLFTPREQERLQGFPDDWTHVACEGVPLSDARRGCLLGNSMAVPVMRWIGERIALAVGRPRARGGRLPAERASGSLREAASMPSS